MKTACLIFLLAFMILSVTSSRLFRPRHLALAPRNDQGMRPYHQRGFKIQNRNIDVGPCDDNCFQECSDTHSKDFCNNLCKCK